MQHMPLEIFEEIQKKGCALGAFNFCNTETLRAIVEAAGELKASVIMATSEGEASFLGLTQAVALVGSWRRQTGLDLILHLDHGKSIEIVKAALDTGYDSVHFDGSALLLEDNITATKEIVSYARQKKSVNGFRPIVEAELGILRGASAPGQKVRLEKKDFTDPQVAAEFVVKTGVDSLAVAVGNVHGIDVSGQDPHLDLARIRAIKKATSVYLVLHGGSGIADEDMRQAIKNGIVKINVNTDLRVAYTQTLKQFLVGYPQETTPYKIMQPVVAALKEVVKNKIRLFTGTKYL